MSRLDDLLEEHNVFLIMADERDRGRHWVGIGDVAASRKLRAIAIPRRQNRAHHAANAIHELVHFLEWERTGKSPTYHDDVHICRLALELARSRKFSAAVLQFLEDDLRGTAKRAARDEEARK